MSYVQPPDNPYEDHLIARLDRGIRLDRDEKEMAEIRADMQWRQRCRLAEFNRVAEARP